VKTGTVQIDGVEFHWSIYRQPTWTSAYKLLGLAILVKSPEPSKRELVLEFEIDPTRHGDMPQHQRFRVSKRRLMECIQNAMKAGWDPNSRGKHFVFEAGSVNLN
jgi:hypothetical protein